MFKKTIATTLSLLLTTIPTAAFAAPTQDQVNNHLSLLNYVDSRDDITVGINVPQCSRYGDKFQGMYIAKEGYAYLIICQDNRTFGSTDIVEWTENDLDTIRHETFHYVQDCYDGAIDFGLRQVYSNIDDVIDEDIDKALYIASEYYNRMDLDDSSDIYLEMEAFVAASTQNANQIATDVKTYCTP